MSLPDLDRRRLTLWLGGWLLGGWALLVSGCRRQASPEELERRLASLFWDAQAARRVGEAYLRGVEDGGARLARRLVRRLGGLSSSTTDAELAARLIEGIRRDFLRGRVVSVEGWQLSQTEALWCALVAQSSDRTAVASTSG